VCVPSEEGGVIEPDVTKFGIQEVEEVKQYSIDLIPVSESADTSEKVLEPDLTYVP